MSKKSYSNVKHRKNIDLSGSDSEDIFNNTIDDDVNSDMDPIEHDVKFKIQSTQSTHLRDLISFLKDPKMINPPGDSTTNIIDRLCLKCYNIPHMKIHKYFKYLEICRRNNVRLMMTERQQEYSGIMLDFDIYQNYEQEQLTDEIFGILTQKIIELLMKILSFEEKKEVIFVGITRKPKVTYSEEKSCYKDGFHILIPGIQIRRGVKKLIINKLIENEIIEQILADVEPADIKNYDRNKFLDINSSFVPVFFIGNSTKKGSSPYKLTHVYEVTMKTDVGNVFLVPNTKILKSTSVNICNEFSLNWESSDCIIRKKKYEVHEKYALDVENLESNTNNNYNNEILANNYGSLSTNSIHDRNIKEIKDLLDTLNIARAENYSTWRDVVFVIANESPSYKDLAEYFSLKSKKFNKSEFEKLWLTAIRTTSSNKKQLTIGSLHYWAKHDNPERYNEVRKINVYTVLYNMVYEGYKEGLLSHADLAKILHMLLQYKFVVDVPEGSKHKMWYEFIIDEDDHIDGELYKWRMWDDLPTSLSIYISETLPRLFEMVFDNVKKNYEKSDGDISKYYNKVLQNFKSTMRKLGDRMFKRNIIQEAEDKFYKCGFAKKLDRDPLVRGVQNGVLKLTLAPGGRPILIQGFHNHLISKYTSVPYIPFNPHDELTKKIIITLRNMFPDNEPDTFDFIMYYLSSTIDGNPKESMFMIMTGGGANGKSFLVELHKGAIGSNYGVKMPISYLTGKSTNADSATPTLMQLKDATFAYYSESNKHEKLNSARVKEVTGLETLAGRKLNQNTINFKPKCLQIVASNYEFDIDTNDHGTWRRIIKITCKIKFKDPKVDKIDPDNPYERKADPSVTQSWTEDSEVQGRYLGFMVWMHYWLYRKYNGKVISVPHPHIEYETEKYRRSQDSITSFLAQRFVSCNNPEEMNPMTEQIQKYISWYVLNNGNSIPAKGISEQFQNSSIGKHIRLTARGYFMKGYRFLDNGETPGTGEEYVMKNVFEMKEPSNNFGIKSENSDEYYERICKEYDNVKHIFSDEPEYDVDVETLIDYHVLGANREFNDEYKNSLNNNVDIPENKIRKDNVQYIDGRVLPSGIVLESLEEPSINYLTDEYHIDMSGFLSNMDDMVDDSELE